MEFSDPSADALLKFADQLHELEVVIGSRAAAVVAEVRAKLTEAAGKRQAGDLPAAIAIIRQAMQRLATLGSELDPAEGAMMKFLAERFTEALDAGDRGAAKEAVNIMRHKAGDPKDEPNSDW